MTHRDSMPASTLDAAATLDALGRGAVVRWWQVTSFLEVAGPDAPRFLDGLCTQAVERVDVGAARMGLFLDGKARIVAPAIVHRVGSAEWIEPRSGEALPDAPRILLELLPHHVEPLHEHLRRYRLRAAVTLEPRQLATTAVVGAGAHDVALPEHDGGTWSRLVDAAPPVVAWIGEAAACGRLVQHVLPQLGLQNADPEAVEAARIDSGVPSLHDLLAGRMPAEVGGMERAVALDAGCYLGQEPVARLHYRGRANRSLRRLEAQVAPVLPREGDEEQRLALRRFADDPSARPVGRLTTWAMRPDGSWTAFAMLRREVSAGDELRAGREADASQPALRVREDPADSSAEPPMEQAIPRRLT